MSKELSRTQGALSFQDRVRQSLRGLGMSAGTGGSVPQTSALLLDVSGSMGEWCSANKRKIDALRELADEFKDVRRLVFSWGVDELKTSDQVPEPSGETSMHLAFMECKKLGLTHLVMITDGIPDNEQSALKHARGLKIDVFYVGPDPALEFLRELARETGGSYGKASLDLRKELEGRVRALLPAGKGGAIEL